MHRRPRQTKMQDGETTSIGVHFVDHSEASGSPPTVMPYNPSTPIRLPWELRYGVWPSVTETPVNE